MTSKTRSYRPSPALVISCVALFLALAGSAFAVGVAKNSVRSAQIVDGTVRTVDLGANSVKAEKIAADAVGAEEIAENTVASPEVADQSLGDADLGPGSVGSSELQTGAIRAAQLGPIIQVSNSNGVAAGGNVSVTATCPVGTTVISGGAQPATFGVELTSTLRSTNGWLAQARNNTANPSTLTAFAYCLSGGGSN